MHVLVWLLAGLCALHLVVAPRIDINRDPVEDVVTHFATDHEEDSTSHALPPVLHAAPAQPVTAYHAGAFYRQTAPSPFPPAVPWHVYSVNPQSVQLATVHPYWQGGYTAHFSEAEPLPTWQAYASAHWRVPNAHQAAQHQVSPSHAVGSSFWDYEQHHGDPQAATSFHDASNPDPWRLGASSVSIRGPAPAALQWYGSHTQFHDASGHGWPPFSNDGEASSHAYTPAAHSTADPSEAAHARFDEEEAARLFQIGQVEQDVHSHYPALPNIFLATEDQRSTFIKFLKHELAKGLEGKPEARLVSSIQFDPEVTAFSTPVNLNFLFTDELAKLQGNEGTRTYQLGDFFFRLPFYLHTMQKGKDESFHSLPVLGYYYKMLAHRQAKRIYLGEVMIPNDLIGAVIGMK